MVTSLKQKQLLYNLSRYYQHEREAFSKIEIVKKLNQIKYLSSQKNVPKLSLRKKIQQLEQQLESITKFEETVIKEKNRESAKVTALKRQIASMKKNMGSNEGSHLHKKVDKLNHLLGESLAKKTIKEDIELSKKVLEESKNSELSKPITVEVNEKVNVEVRVSKKDSVKKRSPDERWEEMRIGLLNKKLAELRIKLSKTNLGSEENRLLQEKVNLIDSKLKSISNKEINEPVEAKVEETALPLPEIKSQPMFVKESNPGEDIKHTLLFSPTKFDGQDLTKMSDKDLEGELPLPLPPRLGK